MSRIRQSGATLIEMVLVLVIMASITVLGLNLYRSISNQNYIDQIRGQVGNILDAMRSYYYANCMTTLATTANSSVTVLTGDVLTLVPYLYTSIQTINPWVNYKDTNTYYGYIAQFNLHTYTRKAASTATYTSGTVYWGDGSSTIGTVVAWSSQVAVEANSAQNATVIFSELGAECLTTYLSDAKGVNLCTGGAAPTGATYVAIEVAPSYGSGHNTVNSIALKNLMPFKHLYENSMLQGVLTGGQNMTGSQNYYYCGS